MTTIKLKVKGQEEKFLKVRNQAAALNTQSEQHYHTIQYIVPDSVQQALEQTFR